jgi:hypothetical protein
MNAPRFAPLECANADPTGGREHCGDFPFTPPAPRVGTTAFRVAEGSGRAVEARKRLLQADCVAREVPFEGKHRSLHGGNVGSGLLRVDRGPRNTFSLTYRSCASLTRTRPERPAYAAAERPAVEPEEIAQVELGPPPPLVAPTTASREAASPAANSPGADVAPAASIIRPPTPLTVPS